MTQDARWHVLLEYNHQMFHRMVQRLAAGREYPISTMLQGMRFALEYPDMARQVLQDFKERDVFYDAMWTVKAADELAEELAPHCDFRREYLEEHGRGG